MGTDQTVGTLADLKVTIHILRGKATRRSREMKGATLLVGSEGLCDVQMRSPDVAGKHCLIRRQGHRVIVSQLDPQYPVLLNGSPISETDASDGDKITIGPFELSLTIEGAAIASAESARSATQVAESLLRTHATAPARPQSDAGTTRPASSPIARQDAAPAPKAMPSPAPVPLKQDASPPPLPTSADLDLDAKTPSEKAKELDDLLASIHHLQVEKQKEVDRREQQLAHQGRMLDDEAAEIERNRARQREEKALIERTQQELAQRARHIDEESKRLHERESALRQTEQAIEESRLGMTEETIELDRRRQAFEHNKVKLLRVRRRLFDKTRERRETVTRLLAAVEQKSAELQKKERTLESDVAHWKKVGEELGRRQLELEQQSQQLAERIAQHQREEKEQSAKRAKLEQDLSNLRIKERALESFKVDLEQRKLRAAEEEKELRKTHELLEKNGAALAERTVDVQRRHEEIEGRARTLEKQEHHVREQAKANEQQRHVALQREHELAIRSADVEEKAGNLRTQTEFLRQREEELNIRENALREESRLQDRRDAEHKRQAEEIHRLGIEMDQRGLQLEERTRSLLEQLDKDRASADENARKLDDDRRTLERERQEFELYKDQWVVRTNVVRESMVEAAQRAGILETREKELWLEQDQNRFLRLELTERERSLEAIAADVESRKRALEEQAALLDVRSASIEEESRRFADQEHSLQERQREIVKRERAWCEEVKRRRGEIEAQTNELDRKRTLMERQLLAHRRHVKKLRDVSTKVVQRRRSLHVQTRHLERRFQQAHQELQALRDQQHGLRGAIAQYADQAVEREKSAAHWLEVVRQENAQLAQVQREIAGQLREMSAFHETLAAAISDSSRSIRQEADANLDRRDVLLHQVSQSLQEWSTQLASFQRSALEREQRIAEEEEHVRQSREGLNQLVALAEQVSTSPPAEESSPLRLVDADTALDDADRGEDELSATASDADLDSGANLESRMNSLLGEMDAEEDAAIDDVDVVDPLQSNGSSDQPAPFAASEPEPMPSLEPDKEDLLADQSVLVATTVQTTAEVVASTSPMQTPAMDDGHWEQFRALGILDAATLEVARQSAGRNRRSLADELLSAHLVTEHQLSAIRDGNGSSLVIGAWIVQDVLHAGAMATTFKVRRLGQNEYRALRWLDARWCRDAAMRESFARAVEPLLGFRHPRIAGILELINDGERVGVVTELVEGRSLAQFPPGAIPAVAQVRLFRQAVGALADVHRRGFLHHSLRPSRFMVDGRGSLRILGYGETDWLLRFHRCERGKALMPFVAPEERGSESTVDIRGDIYSTARVFRQLATGNPAGEPPTNVFPPAYAEMLARVSSAEPGHRCRSIGELLEEIDGILAQPPLQEPVWTGATQAA